MFRGSGVPAIIYKRQIIELPHPAMGGRENPFVPLTEPYEDLDGKLVFGEDREWRLEAKYTFVLVDTDKINLLSEIYNKSVPVKFVPHIDVPQVAYMVILDDISPSDEVHKDGLVIEMRSQKPVTKIPTADNMLSCLQFTKITVYDGGS